MSVSDAEQKGFARCLVTRSYDALAHSSFIQRWSVDVILFAYDHKCAAAIHKWNHLLNRHSEIGKRWLLCCDVNWASG